jgi:ethanolamine-phosphate cytidylyltransferase
VVGVCNDEEIADNKRHPVMTNEERLRMVRACKWADEVVSDVPYTVTLKLLAQENICADFAAHGDDICQNANGENAYQEIIDAHRLRIFKRTPGTSTTTLIKKLLRAAKSNELLNEQNDEYDDKKFGMEKLEMEKSWQSFLPTSHRIAAFSNNRTPTSNDVVVYIDGDFDLFHCGHVNILQEAKKLGTFLYVGLYDDAAIRQAKGKHWPIMHLQERTLCVLSCKYVDEVIIGCPWEITIEMLKSLNVKVLALSPEKMMLAPNDLKRYNVATKLGLIKHIDLSENVLTTKSLVDRMVKHHERFEKQNEVKMKKEANYITEHTYIQEC